MRISSRLLLGTGLFFPTMLFAVVNSPFQVRQIIDLQKDHAPYHHLVNTIIYIG